MSASVQALFEKTKELVSVIESTSFEQLEELILFRDQIIQQLSEQNVIEDADKTFISLLAQFDVPIKARMLALKDEASRELQNLDQTKKQRSGYNYTNPGESYFIDVRN